MDYICFLGPLVSTKLKYMYFNSVLYWLFTSCNIEYFELKTLHIIRLSQIFKEILFKAMLLLQKSFNMLKFRPYIRDVGTKLVFHKWEICSKNGENIWTQWFECHKTANYKASVWTFYITCNKGCAITWRRKYSFFLSHSQF